MSRLGIARAMHQSMSSLYAQSRIRHFSLLLISLTLMLHVSVQDANALVRDDFRINTDAARAEQNHPRIALRPGGGFIVVWTDYRQGQADIYAQLFDANAQPVGINRRLNTDSAGAAQIDPVVAVTNDGRSQAFWTDYRQNGYPFDPDIALQSLTTTGELTGPNRLLTNEFPDSLKATPDIAVNPVTGEMVLVWADFRNLHWDIYAQVLAADGTPIGSNIRINDDLASAQQHAPRIDISPSGWYSIVWYDNRETSDDVFGQLFRPDHSRIGRNTKTNSSGLTARQAFPDVACDATGRFTVAWVDWRDAIYPKNPNIYSRRFDTLWVSLTGDVLMNTDGTERAQRDVSISADSRGNVGVIWSDSTNRNWDITGQMLDVNGNIQELNFVGHSLRDSAQLRGDLTLDGRSRYLVWVDYRNGHWDIYGKISEYNSPKLETSPTSLRFERVSAGQMPANQQLIVTHRGYNPINYTVTGIPDWLRVNSQASSFTGLSIDTLTLSIVDSGLANGTYAALLRLIDLDNADTTVTVSVSYRIGEPEVQLSADTLWFASVPRFNRKLTQSARVTNVGVGRLQWTGTSSAPWITLNPASSTDTGSLSIEVDASLLDSGLYSATVTVSPQPTGTASDSLIVMLNIIPKAYLDITPDSSAVVLSTLDTSEITLEIHNLGIGSLDWQARSTANWLALSDSMGTEGDSLVASVRGFNLAPGTYQGWVFITDTFALNQSDSSLVTLTVHYPGQDTLFLSDLSVGIGGSGVVSLVYRATDSLAGFDFPFLLPIPAVRFDSIQWLRTDILPIPSYDSLSGKLSLATVGLSPIGPGTHELARVYLAGGDHDTSCAITVDPAFQRPLRAVRPDGDTLVVQLSGGSIVVQTGTAVGDEENLPGSYYLDQNYPNPFNPSTTIRFGLAQPSLVRLAVYNILGQELFTLVDEMLGEGAHEIELNSSLSSRPMASGVYFVRLIADPVRRRSVTEGAFVQTVKVLLLK